MNKKKYTETHKIPCYFTDEHDHLTPSAVLDYVQEAGAVHADILGFGRDALIKDNIVWIVSRTHFDFIKSPKWRDTIELSTWHRGLEDRLYFRREFIIKNEQGEPICVGTSYWLLFNMETRAMVRTHPLCERPETQLDEYAMEGKCERLRIPASLQMEHSHDVTVRHSDIDRNGHTNNARYALWAMDAIELGDMRVKAFTINFNHESKLGDTISISRTLKSAPEDPDKTYLVEGKVNDISSFVVEVTIGE